MLCCCCFFFLVPFFSFSCLHLLCCASHYLIHSGSLTYTLSNTEYNNSIQVKNSENVHSFYHSTRSFAINAVPLSLPHRSAQQLLTFPSPHSTESRRSVLFFLSCAQEIRFGDCEMHNAFHVHRCVCRLVSVVLMLLSLANKYYIVEMPFKCIFSFDLFEGI